MDGQVNLKLSVQNFGPIKEGEFELKPLTIFIGPNNSGKSYMATLLYALCQVLVGKWTPNLAALFSHARLQEYDDSSQEEFLEWLRLLFKQGTIGERDILWQDLPASLQRVFGEAVEGEFADLEMELDGGIKDYFGCEEIGELVRHTSGSEQPLMVRMNRFGVQSPVLALSLGSRNGKSNLTWAMPDISSIPISPFYPDDMDEDWVLARMVSLPGTVHRRIMAANGLPEGNTYYLPGARSGILQGWQLFASLALRSMRRSIGIRRMETPAFTGVAADFLQVLLERQFQRRRRRELEPIAPALQVLEGQVLQGRVSIRDRGDGPPLVIYQSGNFQLPIQRASSMIGELAPLDLWIRNLLEPGDLLIIDEPEAHQHPENQRKIAQVMVRLVRAGVKVLCTTHSPMILHQTSNHLLAAEARAKGQEVSGFTDDDLISPEEVGVYLFDDSGGDGTVISSVPIEPGFGISEEEFVRVSEAIGDETFRLSMALPDVEGEPC